MGKEKVLFGIDKLLRLTPDWKGQRIGLLTNDGAHTITGQQSRTSLVENGFNIVRLFSPEHGIKTTGVDGAWMPHQLDDFTHLPVISLYQDDQSVDDKYIEDLDVLLVDLPDVGARFYTYVWTMTFFLEAAARTKTKIVVLDRPNPMGGNTLWSEGPALHSSCESFIGRFDIPVTHHCTLGELALYFNHTEQWGAELSVVSCEWNRHLTYTHWNVSWVNPSPAMINFDAVKLYPGLCLLEGTNFLVGRNTPYSFQWIGNPKLDLRGFKFDFPHVLSINRTVSCDGEKIHGVQFIPNVSFHSPVEFGLMLIYELRIQYAEYFSWGLYPTQANPSGSNHLDLLTGIPNSQELFSLERSGFINRIQRLLKTKWPETIQPFLLYH